MIVRKRSPITGKMNTLDLDITEEQWAAWQSGLYVQNAMPHLTADEREFLISGCAPGEYDETFKDIEE